MSYLALGRSDAQRTLPIPVRVLISGSVASMSFHVVPRHQQPARQVDQDRRADAEDRGDHEQQTQDGRVHAEHGRPAATYARDHLVGAAAAQLLDVRLVLVVAHVSIIARLGEKYIRAVPPANPEFRAVCTKRQYSHLLDVESSVSLVGQFRA